MNASFTIRTLLRGALLAACIRALALPAFAATASGTTANAAAHLSALSPAQTTSTHSGQTMPAALRPVFYQALAKDAGAAYNINYDGCAVLLKQSFKACFDNHGAHFTGAGSPLGLRLVAFGRGSDLATVTSVRPAINDNQASYAHKNITEWWRVLPIGFEQGFTIAKRPTGNGELTLALVGSQRAAEALWSRHTGESRYPVRNRIPTTGRDNLSDWIPAFAGMTNHVVHGGANKKNDGTLAWGKLRYGQLVVTDAKGKVVPATLTGKGDRILIAVNDVQAAYPLTVDPLVWLEQKVTASDGAAGDNFGLSAVAISGTTALVGAPLATFNDTFQQGAAYVFSDSGGSWTQTVKLTANDGATYDHFGDSVALSGTTALIGADQATINGNTSQGAAYVFDDSGGSWTQTQKLTASDGAAVDVFGDSVALDGATALVGAYGHNASQGTAYVFNQSDGTWSQTQELSASDGAGFDGFGYSVALDGATALVGAPEADVNGDTNQGAAYVFDDSGDTWMQTQKLTASDGAAFDSFGFSVALAGTTALAGALGANGYEGAAYFYGESDLGLAVSAPQTVGQGQNYTSQTIATNNASAASPAVTATIAVPAAASFVSAMATQGTCSEASGVVSCDFGSIDGDAGTATANVTLKATGALSTVIQDVAGIVRATPPLTASAPTTITAGGACPDGYTTYSGTLAADAGVRAASYDAPAGHENGILYAPAGFALYGRVDSTNHGRWQRRFSGTEVHRWGPEGTYTWGVKASDAGGAYTLCISHP